jgi:hypothetical protein
MGSRPVLVLFIALTLVCRLTAYILVDSGLRFPPPSIHGILLRFGIQQISIKLLPYNFFSVNLGVPYTSHVYILSRIRIGVAEHFVMLSATLTPISWSLSPPFFFFPEDICLVPSPVESLCVLSQQHPFPRFQRRRLVQISWRSRQLQGLNWR